MCSHFCVVINLNLYIDLFSDHDSSHEPILLINKVYFNTYHNVSNNPSTYRNKHMNPNNVSIL
jgi:hypothetical protein